MTDSGRYAVIATRDRPTELAAVVAALHSQGVHPIVVDNGSQPPATPPAVCAVIVDPEQPPNLSRLWNLGLDEAARLAAESGHNVWDVAVVNDDATIPPGWFTAVAVAMRTHGGAAGCSSSFTDTVVRHGPRVVPSVANRLTGWAFILRGETGLRADERLRWWCGDDDLSAQARNAGGLVMVPGYPVGNSRANSTTVGVLAEQAARDMQTYADIWGRRPW